MAPLEFGNYERLGIGSFLDAFGIMAAVTSLMSFFGLGIPILWGGFAGRAMDETLPLAMGIQKAMQAQFCREKLLCYAGKMVEESPRAMAVIR